MDRAKGIKSRQDREEAVAGLFSHIGELYVVHHIWGECNSAVSLFLAAEEW